MNDRRRAQKQEATPLFDEKAERSIIGCCLHDSARFWEAHGRLKPEHFAIGRLGRIWEAMMRCAEASKPVNQNWIPMMIRGDKDEDTPLRVYLAVLFNDAPPPADAELYAEAVLHLANKRSLLESLDRAKQEILAQDVGVQAEVLKDIGIRHVSNAFSSGGDDDMMSYGDWGARVFARAQKSIESEESGFGLSPGLRAVEETIGRFLPGKSYVLAGMSSSGKSALARQLMEAAALDAMRQKLGPGFVSSLEMTGEEYASRHLAEKLGIAADKMEQGDLNRGEVEAIGRQVARMKNFPLVVDSRVRQKLADIRARALKLRNTSGLSIMAVDHLLLIRPNGPADSMMDRVSEATIEGKNMAKEFGIPAIILAQVNEKKVLESSSKWPSTSSATTGWPNTWPRPTTAASNGCWCSLPATICYCLVILDWIWVSIW